MSVLDHNAEEHVVYQLMNAPLREYPFPHMIIEDIFPKEYYDQLLAHLPPLASYNCLGTTGNSPRGRFMERFITELPTLRERSIPPEIMKFWEDLSSWMTSERFAATLFERFSSHCRTRFGGKGNLRFSNEIRLVRDFTNYDIPPHTDTPRKAFSLLFYLPKDRSMEHLGTSVYIPRKKDFQCMGGPAYPHADFHKVITAPYRPNSVFLFFKTPQSFHGVEPIRDEKIERNLLLYNMYVDPPPEKIGQASASRKEDIYAE